MPESRPTSPIQPATAAAGLSADRAADRTTDRPADRTADRPAAAEILLELVDDAGVTIGTAEKLWAHQEPGGCTGRSRSSSSTSRAGCCCSAAR